MASDQLEKASVHRLKKILKLFNVNVLVFDDFIFKSYYILHQIITEHWADVEILEGK